VRGIEFCECQFVTIVIDIVHDRAGDLRPKACLSSAVVSVFLIMLSSPMDRKRRSTRIGAAVKRPSVSQKNPAHRGQR
jgi:hypothetical protein